MACQSGSRKENSSLFHIHCTKPSKCGKTNQSCLASNATPTLQSCTKRTGIRDQGINIKNAESLNTGAGCTSCSNHVLGIVARHTAVGASFASPSSGVHAQGSFVHVVIVDHFASEHRGSGLALAKQWSRVTPEVTAVGSDAVGERVAGTSGLRALTEPVSRSSKESVDPQERRPLL